MDCDELKLFEYLEGVVFDTERLEIEDHLRECSNCREVLERMRFTLELFSSFYAHEREETCPSAEELVLFRYDMLDKARKNEVTEHIKDCPGCREELRILENFDKQEHSIHYNEIRPPGLSDDILSKIEQLGRKSLREKMGDVLRNIISMGKDAITEDRIDEILDRYFLHGPESSSAYAIPMDAVLSDTKLKLREIRPFEEISFDIGEYQVLIKATQDTLTVKVLLNGEPVRGAEVRLKGEGVEEIKANTGPDGACVINALFHEGFSRLKVVMPRNT